MKRLLLMASVCSLCACASPPERQLVQPKTVAEYASEYSVAGATGPRNGRCLSASCALVGRDSAWQKQSCLGACLIWLAPKPARAVSLAEAGH